MAKDTDENKNDLDIPLKTVKDFSHDVCLSNSFGFGGTNSTLIFKSV